MAKRDRWCQKVPKNVGEAGYRSINPIGEFFDDEEYGKFETKFKHFKSNFGKVYKHEEEHRKRMHIARHNMRFVAYFRLINKYFRFSVVKNNDSYLLRLFY